MRAIAPILLAGLSMLAISEAQAEPPPSAAFGLVSSAVSSSGQPMGVEAGPWWGLVPTGAGQMSLQLQEPGSELAVAPLQLQGAFKAGPVETSIEVPTLLLPGERVGLDRGGDSADMLVAYGSVGPSEVDPTEPVYRDWSLHLVSVQDGRPVAAQELAWVEEFALDAVPMVHWAGDLDHDGRLDVIVDVGPQPEAEQLVLFLSSEAAPGQLVAERMVRRSVGC